MNFGEFLWSLIVIFFMICYFMILFSVIVDLFRNDQMSGIMKAIWIILLIVLPLLALLVYVIVYHKGMTDRNVKSAEQYQQAQADYVKSLAGSGSAADQIAKAQELLTSGAINQQEFDTMKAKALA